MKHRARQALYYIKKFGLEDHLSRIGEERTQAGINRLDGTINYIYGIERQRAEHLRLDWREALLLADREPTYQTITPTNREISFFVDETTFRIDDVDYLALAFARTEEPPQIAAAIRQVLGDYIADPFAKGNKQAVKVRGLHYNEIHFDLRTKFLDLLPSLPFSAAIAFSVTLGDYQNSYYRLFAELMEQAITTSDGAIVHLSIEENSKISKAKLTAICDSLYRSAHEKCARCPRDAPELSIKSKAAEPCTAVPDFLLAAFSSYAQASKSPKKLEQHLEFERIRDKIRYIQDVDRKTFYTRKRPFYPLTSESALV